MNIGDRLQLKQGCFLQCCGSNRVELTHKNNITIFFKCLGCDKCHSIAKRYFLTFLKIEKNKSTYLFNILKNRESK
jgi:flavoprotein